MADSSILQYGTLQTIPSRIKLYRNRYQILGTKRTCPLSLHLSSRIPDTTLLVNSSHHRLSISSLSTHLSKMDIMARPSRMAITVLPNSSR